MKTAVPYPVQKRRSLWLIALLFILCQQSYAQVPANDLCTNAIPLTSSLTCTAVTGTLNNSTVSAPAVGTTCGTAGGDVWYTFVAQSVYPTITLSGLGSSLTPGTNARIQLFSGTCGALTSLGCVSNSILNTATTYPTGLTVGATYYIRVYSNTLVPTSAGTAWDFSICVVDPPVNDLCSNATPITSGLTCTATAGTLNNAAVSLPAVGTTCGTAGGDVWYTFVAQSVYPTITLSSLGTSLTPGTNARIQLFSGTCGALTSLGCVSNSILNTATTYPTGLTVGTTYYIRVYSNTISPTSAGTAWDFIICVTDPPANDLCANAVTLTSGLACASTAGTLNNAAVSLPAIATTCGTAGADVWYAFTAQSAFPTFNLTGLGASLSGNARMQLFSGTCGSLTSLGCASGNILNTATVFPAGLTTGTIYYLRVYSSTVSPTSAGTAWDFSICVVDPPVNDVCTTATTLTSSNIPVPTNGTLNNAAVSGIATTCGTAGGDVWYSFTAQSLYPTITLSSLGTSLTPGTNARIQLFSGTCGALSSLGCVSTSLFNTSVSIPGGLTIGTNYFIRVYSNTLAPTSAGTAWDFAIAVTDPPANDDCVNAVLLTSGSTCSNITGTVGSATFIASGATACTGTDRYDVWYKFVAQRTNPTITLSTVGANFLSPRIQVLSGTCGAFTSVGCGTFPSYTPTGLTIGATYYVRIFSTTAPIPTTAADFSICITDPALPVNDDCTGAINLVSGSTCTATAGTLLNATGTTGIPNDCGAAGAPEVWYSFVAQTAYPNITISSVGAQFNTAGPRLQLLSGTCGSFTSLACVSGTTITTGLTPGGAGLTIGNTYYVRVYTNTAGMAGTGWTFNICVTDPNPATLDYGKSYVNITKGTNGGTIEPGDVLEIHAVFAVKGNTSYLTSFTDNIPTNTSYVPGTLRILTNEGQIYKQWTDAAGDDPGTISGSTVTINMGTGATSSIGGTVRNADRPTLFGGTCMMVASYRVTVTGSYGDVIPVGNGNFTYKKPDGSTNVISFPAVNAVVYRNYGICANTVGTNAILSESGGTFGSGTTKDRVASTNVPTNYAYVPFSTGGPSDYFYGVSNNTSPNTGANYSINPNDPIAANHVFNVWDIIGDHTGATNPLAGNPPTDVNGGATGGYMVVINAAFRTDTAFLDTVKNLCPNTSYEYAAWFRNVCHACSGDSTGKGPTAVGYIPTAPGDSSGVHPNLTFNINGYDYYTTGDILYTGQWIKKGFTYRTGPSETQMVINIRNNAPGGGGNDWAIDDIGVATCSPTLNLNPSTPNVKVCYGDGASLSAQVTSYFDNYTYYSWEKSVDTGATWTSTPYFSNGTANPLFNGTEYEYTAVGPSFIGDSTTHGNMYRLRVATSGANIVDTSCSFLAVRTVQVWVNNCQFVLKADLVNASGTLVNDYSTIRWNTVNETDKVNFEIEKSFDGVQFKTIAKVKSNSTNGIGSYLFADPDILTGPAYYRIKMNEDASFKYSRVILLSPRKIDFEIKNLVNPFVNAITFNAITPSDGNLSMIVFDDHGKAIKTYSQRVTKGFNAVKIPDMGVFSSGIYTLKIMWQNESIVKRVIKAGN